jgi:hypothetical protein
MTRTLRRSAVTEVAVERFTSFDGQSTPTYQHQGTVMARVVREDRLTKRADGSEIRTQYTIWIDAGESPLPLWRDRLAFETLGEGRTAVVEIHEEKKTLRGAVDHVRLLCREE